MISFQNVSFTYAESGNGGVLDLNLVVRSGECVLLCGPSGCGKTTVTRLANGLIPHFFHGNLSGQVNVNGMDTRETEIAALFLVSSVVALLELWCSPRYTKRATQ